MLQPVLTVNAKLNPKKSCVQTGSGADWSSQALAVKSSKIINYDIETQSKNLRPYPAVLLVKEPTNRNNI